MLRNFYPPNQQPFGRGPCPVRDVIVIVIPGLPAAPPYDWHDQSGKWLEKLVDNCGERAHMWAYESTRDPGEKSVVQQLREEGQDLLACLWYLCSKWGVHAPQGVGPGFRSERSIFFICHSLGGIILKHALSLAEKDPEKYRDLRLGISGIVFLGTAHLPSNATPSPNIIELILRLHQGKHPEEHALTATDKESLALYCQDLHLSNSDTLIVSAYETVESRIYQGTFKWSQRVIIASKERSILNFPKELIVATDKSHDDICNVQVGGSLYEAIDHALQDALESALVLQFI